ncbi:MAG TPA: FGGY family carbohydrate kinase [Streptosporangiaceae bacterium]|nr:FGGY family carbohydrate kinase [Streptosporangiaceae bacterium]
MSRPGRAELIIAIDQGTTSLKVAAFDLTGRLVTTASAPAAVRLLGGGTMEGRPEQWWSDCARTLRALLADPALDGAPVRAVAVCGLMHTLVPADASGRALAGAVPLWADQRYLAEPSPAYAAVCDRITGASENSCVGRLAWLLDRDPALRSRVRHLLPVKDFLRLRLTGVPATDHFEAGGTGLAPDGGAAWSPELLALAGVPARWLPPIFPPDGPAGEVTAAAAAATGLPAGTPVVTGTSDWHAALIGSGAFLPDRASLYLGTAGVLGAFRSAGAPGGLGAAVCLGAVTSTGSALDWLAQALGADGGAIAELAGRSEPGARGLIFLPHLMGERGDAVRPDATGTLTGLRLTHQPCDLARAVVEGTALWLRAVAAPAMDRERIDALVIGGGGARQPLNATIAAAVYRRPVIVPEVTEAGALGAAVLAARSLGVVPEDTGWVRTRRVEEPAGWLADKYAEVFDTFARTERALRALEAGPVRPG